MVYVISPSQKFIGSPVNFTPNLSILVFLSLDRMSVCLR